MFSLLYLSIVRQREHSDPVVFVFQVTSLDSMFSGATAFDQDLCMWGEKLPATATVADMFTSSGCAEQGGADFKVTPTGPMCSACGTGSDAGSSTGNETEVSEPVGNDKRPFIDTYELSIAVNDYLADPTNPDSEVAKTYGWPIGTWNVGLITNFVNLFSQKSDVVFDDSLTGWDTSSVDDMSSMLLGCTNCNPDISSWDVSKVRNMYGMFCLTDTFNSDISEWDTANVNNMAALFSQALSFDQDISGWDVSNVSMKHTYPWANADFLRLVVCCHDNHSISYFILLFFPTTTLNLG